MVRPFVNIRKRIVAVKKNFTFILSVLLCVAAASYGASIANPTAQVSDARLSIGASYFVGGSSIGGGTEPDDAVPMMMNRLCARVSYAPVRYVNFGLDFGTAQVSVDQYANGWGDTVPIFNGGFGWSAGGHLKLSTPYFGNYVGLFGLANGNLFRSTNKRKAYYGGADAVGVVGVQVRVPNFGFVSVGPQVYLIQGENRGYDSDEVGKYSNINNVRGWIALDYFPDMNGLTGEHTPYASIEFTMSPKISGSRRVPVKEFSLSVSVGVITPRLYGADKEAEDF